MAAVDVLLLLRGVLTCLVNKAALPAYRAYVFTNNVWG